MGKVRRFCVISPILIATAIVNMSDSRVMNSAIVLVAGTKLVATR